MEIKNAISKCLDDLGLAKATKIAYKKGLDRFSEYLQEQGIETTHPVESLKIEHFIYFYSWLGKNGYAKRSTGVYGASAKAFMDSIVIAGILQPSYFDSLRYSLAVEKSGKLMEEKLPRWPKRDDVSKMLKAAREINEESPRKERDIALVEFLASSGCRISEVIALNIKDLDMKEHSTVVTGKGAKERRIFFSASAADALREYWNARKSDMPSDPVFARHDKGASKKNMQRTTATTARNEVKSIAVVAGIDPNKFSPHYFRHAFAIRVLSETGNLALVQDLLGHKDPKATRVYAKIYAEDLQKAHREIFG